MFTIERVHTTKSASDTINLESRRECEAIMDAIYKENPSYWPYGLNIEAHDGGVYMVREASTRKPVGFTGWQERDEDGVKVGYYSIGILRGYRNNGYAKQAVSKLIKIKSANVDRVQALIKSTNKPSLALADSLGVPVIKEAMQKAGMSNIQRALAGLGLGAGTAAFMDSQTYGRDKSWDEYLRSPMTVSRASNAILNTGLAGAAVVPGISPAAKATMLTSIPVKDLALTSVPAVPSIADSLKDMARTPQPKGLMESLSTTQKVVGTGAGLLAAAGLGYLGTKAVGALKDISRAQAMGNGGRIRVALPTKDPYDEETTLDIPMSDLEVSNSQATKLQRDLRRRIRRESKERQARRTMQGFLIPDSTNAGAGNSKKAGMAHIKNLLNVIYG